MEMTEGTEAILMRALDQHSEALGRLTEAMNRILAILERHEASLRLLEKAAGMRPV